MNCLTVGLLKTYLDCFDDDAFVCIVSIDNVVPFPPVLSVEDCVYFAPANEDCTGIYLYTESAKELCDEE